MADYRAMARAAAQKYGIDPALFERQIQQESGFADDVISGARRSSAGATGIAQLMPVHWSAVDPLDPASALDYAARLMASHLKQYGGDYRLALAAYNAGPGNVEQYGGVPPFKETQDYVAAILGDGGAASTYSGGTGMDPEYAQLQQAERDAWKRWREAAAGKDPASARALPEYTDYLFAVNDRETYESSFGKGVASSGVDPAQQAFENSIAIGDTQIQTGDAAWNRWAKKYEAAQDSASRQIEEAHTRNEANAKLQQNRESTFMPGLAPLPESKTYRPPTYEAAFERWKKSMGVGEEPGLFGPLPPGMQSAPSSGGGGMALPAEEESGPGAIWRKTAPEAKGYQPPTPGNPWAIPASTAPGNTSILGRPTEVSMQAGNAPRPDDESNLERIARYMRLDFGKPRERRKKSGILSRLLPGFAEGVTDFGGGPAMVGEGGEEEFVEIPGVGMVKASGPTLMNLPKGANVIPKSQMLAMQRIRELAQQGDDPRQKLIEQQQRRDDPELQQKVMAALQKAMAGQLALNPGTAPVLEPGQTDLWAYKRALTGVPAFQQPMPAEGAR